MHATALVQNAIQAWEEKNADALASYLAVDLICTRILPQSIDKTQLLALMKATTTAFPDWSFNGHVLNEKRMAKESWSVLYVTAVTGTQTGDLTLPTPSPTGTSSGTMSTNVRTLFHASSNAFLHALHVRSFMKLHSNSPTLEGLGKRSVARTHYTSERRTKSKRQFLTARSQGKTKCSAVREKCLLRRYTIDAPSALAITCCAFVM